MPSYKLHKRSEEYVKRICIKDKTDEMNMFLWKLKGTEWDISAMPFRRRRFGDAVSKMDVSTIALSAMDFRSTLFLPNFWTYPPCQPCSIALGKFLLLVFIGQGGQENLSDVQRKSSLGIWLWVCDLEFVFEQTLASRSAKRVYAFAQRQSLAPRCWNRSSHSGKQLLARDWKYE